jgi:gluconate kinase
VGEPLSRPRALALEFVGLPGAGKSTVAAQVRAALAADVVIHDGGLVQNLWSVIIGSEGWTEGAMEGALEAVVCGMPAGSRFVYFDIDVDTALARIRQRPGTPSRFDQMAAPAARHLLSTHRQQLEWILEGTLERAGAPCLRLDARRAPDELTRDVLGFIASTAGHGREITCSAAALGSPG